MKVPDKEDIAQAMAKVDYTQLKYDDATGILLQKIRIFRLN